MEITKTIRKILSIKRENNEYNKYLKWVVRSIIIGIDREEEKKLIPYKERQIHINWYRTKKKAKREAEFYATHYQSSWSGGSYRKLKRSINYIN